jgi:SAM-dependent methyltransferase
MKAGDSFLQRWRVRKAAAHIRRGSRVLDIGCSDGALFRLLHGRIRTGIGIDPDAVPQDSARFKFIKGSVPGALPATETFDCITLLAVLEHIEPKQQEVLAERCVAMLRPGGRVICTVPSPAVDRLIHLGQRIRVLDGMAAHEHYGFEPSQTIRLFTQSGLVLHKSRRFQLGLNHLFVFASPGLAA